MNFETTLPDWEKYKVEYERRIYKFFHTPRRKKAIQSITYSTLPEETLPTPNDKKEEYRLRQYLLYHVITKKGRNNTIKDTNE